MARAKPIPWPQILDRIASTAEAADALGVQESRVKDYCRDGTLQAAKVGKRTWLIDRLDLRRLVKARAVA